MSKKIEGAVSIEEVLTTLVRAYRSVLYLPASNPKAIAKAQTLDCDAIILDLEDAVSPEAKRFARDQAVAAVCQRRFGSRTVVVRINGLDTEWGEDDVKAVASSSPDAILVPKVNAPADILAYQARFGEGCESDLWAMIETPQSVLNIREIAATSKETRLTCFVMGTNDLAKALNAKPGVTRIPFLGLFGQCVTAARAFAMLVLDGVYNNIEDIEGLKLQCRQAADFGFDGKTLIHPSQIEHCNAAFSPDSAAIEWAQQIVQAFENPTNAGKAAIQVKGQMVEWLHLSQARQLLAAAKSGSKP
jgi:citrate lyase subunit beta / citryl-CoA lyase